MNSSQTKVLSQNFQKYFKQTEGENVFTEKKSKNYLQTEKQKQNLYPTEIQQNNKQQKTNESSKILPLKLRQISRSQQNLIINQLNSENDEQLISKFKELKKKLKDSEASHQMTKQKLSSLQQQLQCHKNIIKKMKNLQLNFQEQRQKNIRVQIKLKNLQSLKQELSNSQLQKLHLKLTLSNYITEMKQLQIENNKLDKMKSMYELKIEDLKAQYQCKLKLVQKNINQLQRQNQKLKKAALKLQTINKKNQIQLQNLHFNLQFQSKNRFKQTNNSKSIDSNTRGKYQDQQQLSQLQKDNQIIKQKLYQLQNQIDHLQQIKIQHQSELEFLQFKQQTYQSHISKMQQHIKKLQEKLLQEKNHSIKQLKRYQAVESEGDRKLQYCLALLKEVIQKLNIYESGHVQYQESESSSRYDTINLRSDRQELNDSKGNGRKSGYKAEQQYPQQKGQSLQWKKNSLFQFKHLKQENPLKDYGNILNQKVKRILDGKWISFLNKTSKQFMDLDQFKKTNLGKSNNLMKNFDKINTQSVMSKNFTESKESYRQNRINIEQVKNIRQSKQMICKDRKKNSIQNYEQTQYQIKQQQVKMRPQIQISSKKNSQLFQQKANHRDSNNCNSQNINQHKNGVQQLSYQRSKANLEIISQPKNFYDYCMDNHLQKNQWSHENDSSRDSQRRYGARNFDFNYNYKRGPKLNYNQQKDVKTVCQTDRHRINYQDKRDYWSDLNTINDRNIIGQRSHKKYDYLKKQQRNSSCNYSIQLEQQYHNDFL